MSKFFIGLIIYFGAALMGGFGIGLITMSIELFKEAFRY